VKVPSAVATRPGLPPWRPGVRPEQVDPLPTTLLPCDRPCVRVRPSYGRIVQCRGCRRVTHPPENVVFDTLCGSDLHLRNHFVLSMEGYCLKGSSRDHPELPKGARARGHGAGRGRAVEQEPDRTGVVAVRRRHQRRNASDPANQPGAGGGAGTDAHGVQQEPALIPRSPLPTASLPPCFTCAVRFLNTCSPNCWESAEAGSPAPSPRPAGSWTGTDTTSHPPPHGSTPPPTSSPSSQTQTQHPPRSPNLRVNYLRALTSWCAIEVGVCWLGGFGC
jgi:hypothetical protein